MSEPINLNKQRKAAAKDKDRRQAEANSLKYGRSKAERILEATRNENVRAALDRHRFEDG